MTEILGQDRTMDRLLKEMEFHDQQSLQRAARFQRHPESLYFTDEHYLDHETWIRPALARLGDLRGKDILDFGCGHGMASVVLARRGARVTAFDLSRGYLAETRLRAEVNRVNLCLLCANGERLPFDDQCFDGIWGNAILHHLNLHKAGREIHRVLRPGGVAVFCEPWGENPLLNWARRSLPYPGKDRTPDEQPLRMKDVRILQEFFPHLHLEGYQLLSMIRRVIHWQPLDTALHGCDRVFLRMLPFLKHWCRYVVITLPRC